MIREAIAHRIRTGEEGLFLFAVIVVVMLTIAVGIVGANVAQIWNHANEPCLVQKAGQR